MTSVSTFDLREEQRKDRARLRVPVWVLLLRDMALSCE